MMSRFIGGKGLFMFNGDWESGNLDKQMAGNVGFFLMPPAQAGGKQAAMSAPLTFGISAQGQERRLRRVLPQLGGHQPAGARRSPSRSAARTRWGRPTPTCRPVQEGTVTASTLAAGATIGEDNGAMDFIANATGAIYAKSWTPQLQKLVAGQQTPDGLLKSVQKRLREPGQELTVDGTADSTARRPRADRAPPAPRRGPSAAGSGVGWVGWLFVAPALLMYAVFVLRPLAADRSVLAVRLERHRPVDLGRARQLLDGVHRPRPVRARSCTRSS